MATLDIEAIDAFAARAYADGLDGPAREQLIEVALPLARYVARRFSGRGEPVDDLVQVASAGLVKAVDRFDPARGVRFSTYATPTMMGELKRHFRDAGWAMHLPRRLKERVLLLRDVMEDLGHETGGSPTAKQLAERTGLTVEEVMEGLDSAGAYSLDSLDATRGDDDDPLQSIGGEDWGMELAERWATVGPLLAELDERERRILHLRFIKGRTQSQIAKEIGYSQMHVSRLLARTLAKLRETVHSTAD